MPLMKIHRLSSDIVECNDLPYQTVLFDDFNNRNGLLDTSIWSTRWNGPPPLDTLGFFESRSVIRDSELTINGGNLNLSVSPLSPPGQYSWTEILNGDTLHMSDTRRATSAVIISRKDADDHDSGCWRYGKFSTRAKFPRPEAVSAFWLFGWAGEIDVWEIFFESDYYSRITHSYHAWDIVDGCDRQTTAFNLLQSSAASRGCPGIGNEHLIENRATPNPDGLFNEFHEYTLEWTPYKLVWYVDGNPRFEMFRYYEVFFDYSGRQTIHQRGLDCGDLPKDTTFTDFEIWENLAWNRLSIFAADLILGTDVGRNDEDVNLVRDSAVVDWIKVEQRIGIPAPSQGNLYKRGMCIGDEVTITVPEGVDYRPGTVSWNVDPTIFEIVSTTDQTITVKAIGSGVTSLELEYETDLNIGSTPQAPQSIKSYSCHRLSIETPEFRVGTPPYPLIEHEYVDCQGFYISTNSASFDGDFEWHIMTSSGNEYWVYGQEEIFIPLDVGETVQYIFTLENNCNPYQRYGTLTLPSSECNIIRIQVYPNPTNGLINYQVEKNGVSYLQSGTPTDFSFELVNAQSFPIDRLETSSDQGTFDLSYEQAGVYYIKLNIEGRNIISSPIIKQ